MGGIHDRDVWRLKLTHFCHSSRWQTMKERIIGEDIIWRALEVTLADNLVSKANIGVAFVTFWWRLHGQRHLASLFFIYWCNNETENETNVNKKCYTHSPRKKEKWIIVVSWKNYAGSGRFFFVLCLKTNFCDVLLQMSTSFFLKLPLWIL